MSAGCTVGGWDSRVTAFTVTRRGDGGWLMVRHRRLGVIRWEVPGGHSEHGETLEQTAVRETAEETNVAVDVENLAAICVHEWPEQRQRRLIAFFTATPRTGSEIRAPLEDPAIVSIAWIPPLALQRSTTSAFLHPLLDAADRLGSPGSSPLYYRAQHRALADGTIGPAIIGVDSKEPPNVGPR